MGECDVSYLARNIAMLNTINKCVSTAKIGVLGFNQQILVWKYYQPIPGIYMHERHNIC